MRRLIVDGYNLLSADPVYVQLAERDIELARDRLVADVSVFASGEYEATVVFDGGANPRSDGATAAGPGGVAVVFSPFGAEADQVVEALAFEARRDGVEALVVTSDLETRRAVLGPGVAVLRAASFSAALREGETDWREHVPVARGKVKLEDRIDKGVRARLWRWLRPGHGDEGGPL